MKFYLTSIALLISCNCILAQITQYATIFFEDKTVETPNSRFFIGGVMAEDNFIKAKVKITNFTDKTLVVKPEECSYVTPAGEIFSKDKWMVIAPREQESKTIDVKGDGIKTEAVTLKLNGLYICNNMEIITAPDSPLIPEEVIMIGKFMIVLNDVDRNGKELRLKMKITYTGDKVGIFNPSHVYLKSSGGVESQNQKGKDKMFSFKPKEDFSIGFLFLTDSKKDNVIAWKDAFSEGTPEKTQGLTIDFKMDLTKTKAKN